MTNRDAINTALDAYEKEIIRYYEGERKTLPRDPKMPVFISFIRQPYCAAFSIHGHPGTKPYEFMAVNAHLYFGNYITDRRQEFDALMEWLIERTKENDRAFYPNFILLGDLNLDFNSPENDKFRIEKHLKTFNNDTGEEVSVYFPFIDKHPVSNKYNRSNIGLDETFDQIGLFSRDSRLPAAEDKNTMGQNPTGPDYGVFNFANLFSQALKGKFVSALTSTERKNFIDRFEFEVSDHMPLWVRLPLPVK